MYGRKSRPGQGVGVSVWVAVGVTLGVNVIVGLGDVVGVRVCVNVGVAVGVGDMLAGARVAVGVGEADANACAYTRLPGVTSWARDGER